MSQEFSRYEWQLKDLLFDQIKLGLAILRKKTFPNRRDKTFKCCLEWSNPIFDVQFELKPENVDEHLNQRIFKNYLKGPNGKKDKRKRSLLDLALD